MTIIFGGGWDAPVCEGATEVETPIGQPCGYCEEPVVLGEQGVMQTFVYSDTNVAVRPVHKECSLREVLGGIGHLRDHNYWCTTMGDPNGGLSRRDSALAVWEWVEENGVAG